MYETPVAKQRKATTDRDVKVAKVLDDLTIQMRAVADGFASLPVRSGHVTVHGAAERAAEFEAEALKGKS